MLLYQQPMKPPFNTDTRAATSSKSFPALQRRKAGGNDIIDSYQDNSHGLCTGPDRCVLFTTKTQFHLARFAKAWDKAARIIDLTAGARLSAIPAADKGRPSYIGQEVQLSAGCKGGHRGTPRLVIFSVHAAINLIANVERTRDRLTS